jgi:hypothetical protein
MITNEDVSDISHIRTWEDVKKVFGKEIEKYPGINKTFQSGNYGRLWKIKGQELSLKITTDPEEIKTAQRLKGKSNSGFLDIYEIVEVPAHKHSGRSIPKLQLRVQEFCYPIKELQSASDFLGFEVIANIIRGNFDEIKKTKFNNLSDVQEFYKGLEDIRDSHETIELLLKNKQSQTKLAPLILKFVDLLQRLQTDLPGIDVADDLDIHDENIMQSKQGVWKLVDF